MTDRKLAFSAADSRRRRRHFYKPIEDMGPKDLENHTNHLKHLVEGMKVATKAIHSLLEDEELWKRLYETRDKLDEATDELMQQIERVEEALVEKAKGRCASVELFRNWALLFWHHKGRWGLYTINHSGVINRLAHAPRHVRVKAVGVLEDLWNQLQYEDEGEDS